jgi:hypothetical protein
MNQQDKNKMVKKHTAIIRLSNIFEASGEGLTLAENLKNHEEANIAIIRRAAANRGIKTLTNIKSLKNMRQVPIIITGTPKESIQTIFVSARKIRKNINKDNDMKYFLNFSQMHENLRNCQNERI